MNYSLLTLKMIWFDYKKLHTYQQPNSFFLPFFGMVAFKSGSILVLKPCFSKMQSIPMETCFFKQHFPFGFWLWTTYMIICYITKNSIPAQSLSLQHRSSGKLCVAGVEAERVMRGCEGMLAFQKGRSRTAESMCEWQTPRREQTLHCPCSPWAFQCPQEHWTLFISRRAFQRMWS